MSLFLIVLFTMLGIPMRASAQSKYTLDGKKTLVICQTKAPRGHTDEDFTKALSKLALILTPLKTSGDLERAVYFREINKGVLFVLKDSEGQKSENVAKKVITEFRSFSKKENLGQGNCEIYPLALEFMTD